MRLLLDTHMVLWFYLADPQLSASASAAIVDPANEKWVSPGSGGSNPTFLTNVHGILYFQANGTELWGSVGTANSTVRIRSFNTASGGAAPQLLTSVLDKLFFEVDDGIHGFQLWVQGS